MERLKTAFMQILWHTLLSRFNAVSQKLQKGDCSSDDYRDLITVVVDMRNKINEKVL